MYLQGGCEKKKWHMRYVQFSCILIMCDLTAVRSSAAVGISLPRAWSHETGAGSKQTPWLATKTLTTES